MYTNKNIGKGYGMVFLVKISDIFATHICNASRLGKPFPP